MGRPARGSSGHWQRPAAAPARAARLRSPPRRATGAPPPAPAWGSTRAASPRSGPCSFSPAGALGSGVRPRRRCSGRCRRATPRPRPLPRPPRPRRTRLRRVEAPSSTTGLASTVRARPSRLTSTATQALPSGVGPPPYFAALARPVTAEQMAAAVLRRGAQHRAVGPGRPARARREPRRGRGGRRAARLCGSGSRLVSLDRALTDRAWALHGPRSCADPRRPRARRPRGAQGPALAHPAGAQ